MEKEYDLAVIGGGPAGYSAAIRAAQHDLKVVCIESWANDEGKPKLGGTCLNVGCIPSKALLDTTHKFHDVHSGAMFDIGESASIDVGKLQEFRSGVVDQLTAGVAGLFAANKIAVLQGKGSVLKSDDAGVLVGVDADGDQKQVLVQNVLIATGSVPINIPVAPLDHEHIVDSTAALEFDSAPESLVVIGAGVIGLEIGSIWSRLGTRVTVLEALPDFLPMVDKQVARLAMRELVKQGLDIRLGSMVTKAEVNNGQVEIAYKHKDEAHTLVADKCLVAVGRAPNTRDVAASDLGLAIDERGFIAVDAGGATNIPNVYAAGDCTPGAMLAHRGMAWGEMIADRLAGEAAQVNDDAVPGVIYTSPEIAWVDAGVERAEKTINGNFSMSANGRAIAAQATSGQVKVVADAETHTILGVYAMAANAGEIVQQAAIAIEFGATIEDIGSMVFGHPSVSEAFKEAALDCIGMAIHKARPKR